MALLSLGFLLLAIMLGFIRKMNTGLLCIAFALLLGRMAGISDAEIIKGFNASLFLMLLGVTYLFSLAQINGSLDLLAQKVISLAGKRVYLIPIIIYVFSIILAALGPDYGYNDGFFHVLGSRNENQSCAAFNLNCFGFLRRWFITACCYRHYRCESVRRVWLNRY